MIELNRTLYSNLTAGAAKYTEYANKLLAKVPKSYRAAAQDGSIAIESFKGKVGEKTLEAIENYREWVQKAADATQQAEETLTEISSLAKQAIDNIAADYENKTSLRDSKIEQFEAYNALLETDVGFESAKIYQAMIKENNKNIATLQEQRDKMLAELNEHVVAGNIKKYSQDWYDAINDISAVDTAIIELKTDTEDWQDAINELHWEHFGLLESKLEAVADEAENLIDILSNKDLVDETGEWTKEGITSLGLYAQQMEVAEVKAKEYREQINYLNKNWKKLGYTEQEYIDKLEELKSAQYDSIQAYHDAKDAIVDLNSERVEAIKTIIEDEISAYEELIDKKKEALDAEKDLYDFQKSVAKQEKDIANIERQLAALAADNSASARAKRAQLEAELAEANAALEETYYERSISNQQEALDKELENFQDEKNKEIESWEEYLENTELVVSDSLATIKANTDAVYQTLKQMGSEYGLSITESLTSPWKEGEYAVQSYTEKFKLAMSATVEELKALEAEFNDIIADIEKYGGKSVNNVNKNSQNYTNADYKKPSDTKQEQGATNKEPTKTDAKTIKVGGKINAKGAKIYGRAGDKTGEKQYFANDPIYKVLAIEGNWIKARYHKSKSGTTGWFKKKDVKAYAKGTTGVANDQLAWIDELGEELVMRADGNGRLAFLSKGTSVIPADLTDNLMSWGEIDPSSMIERNRPAIGMSPSVINKTIEFSIDASVGELIHVEHLDGNNPVEIAKIVDKAWDKRMKELNGFVRKYSR